MAPVTSPSSRDSPPTTTTPGAGGGLSSFVRGGLSGGVNVLVTFPINKVMFRQQLQGSTSAEAVAAMRREGGRNLYRGLGPPLMQKAVSTSLMFGIYSRFPPSGQPLMPRSAESLPSYSEVVLL